MAKTHTQILSDISKLVPDEKSKLFSALKRVLYPENHSINQITQELREVKFSCGLICPHCGGEKIYRHGKLQNRQRYRCRACLRTFNDFTNTPMQRTKLPDKWLQFLECMHKGLSLRKAAEEIGGVTYVTLFYWRHKVLSALKRQDIEHFDGITELDETYFLYSEKGQRHITGRKSRHRGGKAKKRGISNEQIGVMVACDRHKQSTLRVAGTGRASAERLEQMLGNKMTKDIVLCSDADTAIKTFAGEHKIEHVVLNANKKQRVKQGIYHIQHANSCHKELKGWMDRFRGVATKYLDNYLAWYRFITASKFEAMASKRNQMLVAASQFNVVSTCRSLRIAMWDLADNPIK
jgi:transposase-like protein